MDEDERWPEAAEILVEIIGIVYDYKAVDGGVGVSTDMCENMFSDFAKAISRTVALFQLTQLRLGFVGVPPGRRQSARLFLHSCAC